MADGSIQLDDLVLIPSRAAAEATGYTQDYVGQLARAGLITARRTGGLWYVSLESLKAYKEKADSYVPQPPQIVRQDPDAVVTLDGKDYLSAARAAKVTGYHQDYVSQLAREGAVLGRQIGNRWYVERVGILEHKRQKDTLLGAVQSQSVGIPRTEDPSQGESAPQDEYFTYTNESGDLIPMLKGTADRFAPDSPTRSPVETDAHSADAPAQATPVPIRVVERPHVPLRHISAAPTSLLHRERTGRNQAYIAAGTVAATVVIVIAVGLTYTRGGIFASSVAHTPFALPAAVSQVATTLGDMVEVLFARELVYVRE